MCSPGTMRAGQKASCSFSLKKLSGFLFSTRRPTGCRGNKSSGQILVTSCRRKQQGEISQPDVIIWCREGLLRCSAGLGVCTGQVATASPQKVPLAPPICWCQTPGTKCMQCSCTAGVDPHQRVKVELVLVLDLHCLDAQLPLRVVPSANCLIQVLQQQGRRQSLVHC